MRTFVTDRQTDRRTDGGDYIGPEAGPKMGNGNSGASYRIEKD